MDPEWIETSSDKLTLSSVDERNKQVTDPILRRIEDLYVLLVGRTEVVSAGNWTVWFESW